MRIEFMGRVSAVDKSEMQLTSLEWAALTKHGVAAATVFGPTRLELLADTVGLGGERVRQLVRDQIARVLASQLTPPRT